MKQIFFSIFLILFYIEPLVAADYPPVVGVALSKASPFFKQKQYDKAAAVLRETLTKDGGKHKEIYLMLGNCSMLQGRNRQAEKSYMSALQFDRNDASLWLNLGKAQYELKNYEEAAHSFYTAWEKFAQDKRKPEPLYYSAGAWLMAKKSSKAIAAFDRLFAAYPKKIKSEWREQYLHALLENGQIKKALPLLKQMIATSTGKKKMQWQKILLSQYLELKMYGEAAKMARTFIEKHPDVATWWKALCHVQLAAGKLEEALTALLAYSYLQPLTEKEESLLADLYLESNVPIKASPLYEGVLRKKYQRKTLKKLIVCLYRQGDYDTALQILSRYEKEVLQSVGLLQLQGQMYYDKQEFSPAAQAYGKAAVFSGRHQGQCWLMAGYAALQGDDLHKAERYLGKATQFSSQQKRAQGALEIVKVRLRKKEALFRR